MRWVLIALAFIALTVGPAVWLGRPRPVSLTVSRIGEGSVPADLSMDRIRADLRQLTLTPSRLTGSPGAATAATHIQSVLSGLGARVETFEVAAPVPHTAAAFLSAAGATGEVRLPLHPLWPNLARTVSTPPEGLSGPLLDVGGGSEAELSGKPLRGALVVMDWACDLEWLSVPEFGGRAVIFRGNDEATGYTARRKFLSVPADVPRYYVDPADLPALDRMLAAGCPAAVVHCTAEWQPAPAVSILAKLTEGTAPAGSADAAPVVFHAYYDSISVVPDLAPGAEQACGAAVLLELSRYFVGKSTRRPVYALFTGGHGQALAGMIDMTARLRRGLKHGWPEAEKDSLLAGLGTPGLLVGLDLSSRSDRCGIFALGRFRGQYEHLLRPKFKVLAETLDKYAQAQVAGVAGGEAAAADATATPYLVDCVNLTRGRGWWTYFPYQAPFESEVPVTAGFPAISLSTVNDDRRYVDTPGDRFERLRLDVLERQVTAKAGERAGLAAVARAIAEWSGPFVSSELTDVWADLDGRVVWLDQEKDYTPNQPLHRALVFLKTQRGDKHLMGTRGVPVAFTDERGRFSFPGLLQMTDNWQFRNCLLEAYGTASPEFVAANPAAMAQYRKILRRAGKPEAISTDGSLIYGVDMARQNDYPWTVEMRTVEQHLNLVCFPCRAVTLTGLTDPRGYIPLKDASILEASTLSAPFQFGRSSPDALWGDDAEALVTLWGDPTLRVMLTLGLGFQGKRLILLNNTVEQPEGAGFVLEDLQTIPSMVLQGAGDMLRLDESRIRKLERNGVRNPRLRQFHDEAKAHLGAAREAMEHSDWRTYRLASEKCWALEGKAYSETLTVINNMIRGVLFYLALLLPFSYCLERLIFAAGTIKRRMIGIAGIFSACFLLLAAVHPAFRFTLTPFLVLLAFIIVALVATVSVLIVARMDAVLQERKRALVGRHDERLNVGGIAVRAVDLGISNIRRRPQRGILTGLTVVMVTFILLSFTSLTPVVSLSRLRHPEGVPTYRGLLVRDRGWQPLPLPLQTSVQRTFAPMEGDVSGTVVAARAWYFSDRSGQLSQVDLTAVDGHAAGRATVADRTFTAVALVGMEPTEATVTDIGSTLTAGRWFSRQDEAALVLPQHIATQLGLGQGAEAVGRRVRLFGQEIPVIGIFDERRLDSRRDIDGEWLTPVNFVMQQELRAKATSETEKPDTLEEYIHYGSDQIAVVPFALAMRLGATVRSVAVRAGPGVDLQREAEGYTKRSNLTILACDGQDVTLFAAMDTSQLSAAWQIVVPLFLGFVMVLGTMMGSVYERRREIFVYNSVGLSPGSVSSLFLAESTVYAIVGAGLGYLLGQAVSRLFQVTGILGGLTMNYTAGTTVLVTALTMLIVLLSTVYPARQAFHAATPDVEKETADVGDSSGEVDVVSLYLPFVTVPANAMAMQAYMREFLASIEGVTVGQLAVDQLSCRLDAGSTHPTPTLCFRAWLAPFDLGISHDVELRVVFRDERGICQYHLRARRYSGDHQNWRRLMPRFVFALRRQLLMWRVLPDAEIETYRERGRRLFAPASATAAVLSEARP